MAKGTKVAAPKGKLAYVFIKGEGRNQALQGQEKKMMYVASVIYKKDSPEHKELLDLTEKEWARYKEENPGAKKPKDYTNGIKPVMVDGDELDEDGDPIKVETDEVIATFKTNTMWPAKGNKPAQPQIVKVFNKSGKALTEAYQAADFSIGEGSEGVIHGMAQGNDGGGNHKVSLYLAGVQLSKLVKYEGDTIETEEIDGEDIDFDDGVSALETPTNAGETPNL